MSTQYSCDVCGAKGVRLYVKFAHHGSDGLCREFCPLFCSDHIIGGQFPKSSCWPLQHCVELPEHFGGGLVYPIIPAEDGTAFHVPTTNEEHQRRWLALPKSVNAAH